MNTEAVDLGIVRREAGYFVIVTLMGETKEIGPLATETDARLYYNHFMEVAKRGGGVEIPTDTPVN